MPISPWSGSATWEAVTAALVAEAHLGSGGPTGRCPGRVVEGPRGREPQVGDLGVDGALARLLEDVLRVVDHVPQLPAPRLNQRLVA